MVDSTWILS